MIDILNGEKYQLYEGDCLQVMKQFPDGMFDACITDPPYGINYMKAGGRNPKNGWNVFNENDGWDKERPNKDYFDNIRRIAKIAVIWGGNYFTDYLPSTMQWFIWDKGQRNFSLADFEMAWSSQNKAGRIFNYSRGAALQDGKIHPTQKPLALMRWCIERLPPEVETVIDPFMGSGTTGVACAQLGRRFVGIELDHDYFEIARKRIENAYAQPLLFDDITATPEMEQPPLMG